MKFVKGTTTQTLEVKHSRFIAYLMPYSRYKQTLLELQGANPKARHFVVAYRYLNEYNQVVEHSSDDGEPKGTSGKPSLFVLQGSELINSAVIIVRYFGGTKLGTGGLVRAYSDSVNLVINSSNLQEYKQEIYNSISLEYSNIRRVDYECLEHNIEVVEKVFDTQIMYKLKASKSDMNAFLTKVQRLVQIVD